MPAPLDVAVLAQDPRFAGGVTAMVKAFAGATRALGRDPHLVYLSRADAVSVARRSFARRARAEPLGTAVPSLLPEVDAINQLTSGRRLRPLLREARSLWVVAASGAHGWAAARTGRPYACWLATGTEDEWRARRGRNPPLRELALRANAPPLQWIERRVVRGAEAVFAISPASRRSIAEAGGLPLDRVGVLPLPVDLDAFAPAPDGEWRARLEREPALVFVGRGADPRKNVALLLAAWREVRAAVPSARLVLVGQPPPGPPPPGVEHRGEVASVARELREGSLFVLPSLQEGFGIVVAEALAAGLPAVVTPCGGPEDLVRESGGGRVLDGFEPGELAAAIVDLLGAPDRLAAMRAAGRAHVEREHSPERLRELLAEPLARAGRLG